MSGHEAHVVEQLIAIATRDEDGAEENGLVKDARRIVRRLRDDRPEIVEQGTLMPKAATIPDGWSYDDINDVGRFVGNWWGIRLKRGEPMLYQKGHVLFLRQFEFYTLRDQGYYERLSRVPGQTVLLVIGFYGKREGWIEFVDGEMSPIRVGSSVELADRIVTWLNEASRNPLPDWDRDREGF